MKLSDDLNRAPLIEKMKEYLRKEGQDFSDGDICPLDIFQAMIESCVLSSSELSKLTEMMEFCSRNDLIKRIDEFKNNRDGFKKGKVFFRSINLSPFTEFLQTFFNDTDTRPSCLIVLV